MSIGLYIKVCRIYLFSTFDFHENLLIIYIGKHFNAIIVINLFHKIKEICILILMKENIFK
jgi:hypothetical protein